MSDTGLFSGTLCEARDLTPAEQKALDTILPDTSVPPDATQHFQVGDIIENTWGYGQTNWYFYKILKVTKRFVVVRRLEEILVSGSPIWGGKSRPGEKFHPSHDEVEERHGVSWSRVSPGKALVKLRFHHGEKWDGKDKSITGYN
jgi:hypothetical protein